MTALFWKGTAAILVTAVLVLAVGRQEQHLALLLTMTACVLAGAAAFSFLEPVLDLLARLEQLGDLQQGMLGALLKIAGIGLVTDLAAMTCQDSGNASLARGMRLLGTAAMLSLSVPILNALLDLIQDILVEL